MGISIVFGSLINEIFGLFSKIPIVLILGKIGDVIFAENKFNIFVIIGHNWIFFAYNINEGIRYVYQIKNMIIECYYYFYWGYTQSDW